MIDAIKHDITIYAAHTNMDVVANGVSGRMADKLDLHHRQILQPEGDPMDGNGFGIIGELQQPVESMAFLQQVKEIFRCDRLRYTTPHTSSIQRVAVCGGAGASFSSRPWPDRPTYIYPGISNIMTFSSRKTAL